MRQCMLCGGTFLSGESFCTYCGEPLVPGARRKESKYDNKKNSHGQSGSDDWDFSAFAQAFGEPSDTPPPIKMFGPSRFDRFVAAALAFTLGTFGVHWYFLGNRRRAIWYTIFFWTGIPTILGIIDGIMLLGGTARNSH